jgi:TPR repeat protein
MEVEQDYQRAIGYYSESYSDGNSLGCELMGDSYRAGNGSEKNVTKSDEYFEKACSMGDQSACNLKDSR